MFICICLVADIQIKLDFLSTRWNYWIASFIHVKLCYTKLPWYDKGNYKGMISNFTAYKKIGSKIISYQISFRDTICINKNILVASRILDYVDNCFSYQLLASILNFNTRYFILVKLIIVVLYHIAQHNKRKISLTTLVYPLGIPSGSNLTHHSQQNQLKLCRNFFTKVYVLAKYQILKNHRIA